MTALLKHQDNPTEHIIVDGGCDTCSIGGKAWIIDYTTDKYVDVTGLINPMNSRMYKLVEELLPLIYLIELPSYSRSMKPHF